MAGGGSIALGKTNFPLKKMLGAGSPGDQKKRRKKPCKDSTFSRGENGVMSQGRGIGAKAPRNSEGGRRKRRKRRRLWFKPRMNKIRRK